MIGRERWRTRPICDLLDAAIQHTNIRARCRCGNVAVFHAAGLWHRFQQKGWPDIIGKVASRLRCQCGRRGPRLELAALEPETVRLPLPDDREWKRALSRRR